MAFLREPYPEDVANRVARDYAPDERERVMAILNGVRDIGWYVPWIQLAALRAAAGNLRLLQQWVDLGNADPRDLQLSLDSLAGPGWERDFIIYEQRSRNGALP
jgi:hypothetical protein